MFVKLALDRDHLMKVAMESKNGTRYSQLLWNRIQATNNYLLFFDKLTVFINNLSFSNIKVELEIMPYLKTKLYNVDEICLLT